MGLGVYTGLAATRGFFEDWLGNYDEFQVDVEEILDLGSGVTLAVIVQQGRPAGSDGEVQLRYAAVAVWADGLIVRVTNYGDQDEARTAEERLAEERGKAVSEQSVKIVRRAIEAFNRGDLDAALQDAAPTRPSTGPTREAWMRASTWDTTPSGASGRT